MLSLWRLFHWGSATFIIIMLIFAFMGPPGKRDTPPDRAEPSQAAPADAPIEYSKKFNF